MYLWLQMRYRCITNCQNMFCIGVEQVIADLTMEIDEALCALEKSFPVANMVMMLHLLRHLPQQILEFGPLQVTWMFYWESFIGAIKGA